MKLRDAGSGDAREKADVQEALIRSEEQRLALAKALIDFQVGRACARAFRSSVLLERSRIRHPTNDPPR